MSLTIVLGLNGGPLWTPIEFTVTTPLAYDIELVKLPAGTFDRRRWDDVISEFVEIDPFYHGIFCGGIV